MIIDISDILYETGSSKAYEGKVVMEGIEYQGENIRFDKPFDVKGNIINGGEMIVLNAHLKGKAILQCGSCMESYSYLVDHKIDVNLKATLDEDDPDFYVYSNDRIDLSDIMLREFLLRIPIRRRCSQECQGLCPHCGVNLNKEECQCENGDQQHIDSRFTVLKDLFPNRNGEV